MVKAAFSYGILVTAGIYVWRVAIDYCGGLTNKDVFVVGFAYG